MNFSFPSSVWLMLLVTASSFADPSFADSPLAAAPSSIQASYNVYKGNIRVAQIDETYTRNKDRYTLSSTTRAVGLL
ncbi:MAG: hypothetical protein ABI536_02560, partial [Gallionella sp.]